MKGKIIGFVVALLSIASIGVIQINANAVDGSRDCDQFAVIRCGTLSLDELRTEYNTNNRSPSNGSTAAQNDIKQIFSSMGISANALNGGNFKNGVVYRDGRVVVEGKTVATGAVMAARGLGGTPISGTGASRVSVSKMADAQTALVKFDQNNRFMFAVIKPCANPVAAKPTPPPAQPSAVCKNFSVTNLERTKFRFNAKASVNDGAKVRGYTFHVTKDGNTVLTKTINSSKLAESYTYTQKEAGTYQVRLTVHTSEGKKSSSDCVARFTVPKSPTPAAPTPSISITKHVEGVKYAHVNVNVDYSYQIAVTNTGNKDLTKAVVTDKPQSGVTLVSAEQGSISNNVWTHTIPTLKQGETIRFTLKAKVPEYMAGRITNTVCVDTPDITGNPDDCDEADVDVPKPEKVVVCNPDTGEIITVDKKDENKYVPVDSPECKKKEAPVPPEAPTPTPEALPETGPTETIMQLFGIVSLVGASAYYLTSGRQ